MSNISRAQGFAVTLRCPLDVCVVLVEYPDMSDASPIVEAIQAVETQVRAKYFFASRAACYTRVRLQLVRSLCTVEWPQHLGTLAGCSRHGVMMGSPLRCGCRVDRCARVRSLDHLQMACAVPARQPGGVASARAPFHFARHVQEVLCRKSGAFSVHSGADDTSEDAGLYTPM